MIFRLKSFLLYEILPHNPCDFCVGNMFSHKISSASSLFFVFHMNRFAIENCFTWNLRWNKFCFFSYEMHDGLSEGNHAVMECLFFMIHMFVHIKIHLSSHMKSLVDLAMRKDRGGGMSIFVIFLRFWFYMKLSLLF